MDVSRDYMTSALPYFRQLCRGRQAHECVEEGVASVETRASMVEYVYHCGDEYTEEVKQKSVEMFTESQVPHRNTCNWQIEGNWISWCSAETWQAAIVTTGQSAQHL
jgi:hypothetical protein